MFEEGFYETALTGEYRPLFLRFRVLGKETVSEVFPSVVIPTKTGSRESKATGLLRREWQ